MPMFELIKDGRGQPYGFKIFGHFFDLRQWYRIEGDPDVIWYLKDEIDEIDRESRAYIGYKKISRLRTMTRLPYWMGLRYIITLLIGISIGLAIALLILRFNFIK